MSSRWRSLPEVIEHIRAHSILYVSIAAVIDIGGVGFRFTLLGETHAEETSARFHPLPNLQIY